MRTLDFLDEIKRRNNLPSDYALAKFLGIRPNRISIYRHGGTMDGELALIVAERGGWPVEYVLACIEAERSKRPQVKKAWEKIAHRFAAAIGAVFIGVSTLGSPAPARAASSSGDLTPYTLCDRRRRKKAGKAENLAATARSAARGLLDLLPTPKQPRIVLA